MKEKKQTHEYERGILFACQVAKTNNQRLIFTWTQMTMTKTCATDSLAFDLSEGVRDVRARMEVA